MAGAPAFMPLTSSRSMRTAPAAPCGSSMAPTLSNGPRAERPRALIAIADGVGVQPDLHLHSPPPPPGCAATVDRRPLDVAGKHEAERPVARVPPGARKPHRTVRVAHAFAARRQQRRAQGEVAQRQSSVRRQGVIRLRLRQPAAQRAQNALSSRSRAPGHPAPADRRAARHATPRREIDHAQPAHRSTANRPWKPTS